MPKFKKRHLYMLREKSRRRAGRIEVDLIALEDWPVSQELFDAFQDVTKYYHQKCADLHQANAGAPASSFVDGR